jgi:hypothetical protein
MSRHLHQDPTQLFSVVGSPYIREAHGQGPPILEQLADPRPSVFKVGVAPAFAVFAVVFGVTLFASSGTAKLFGAACSAVK